MNFHFGGSLFGLVMLVASTGVSAAQTEDSITQMCALADAAIPGQTKVCTCALRKVATETADEDFALYAQVGSLYFNNLANGMAMSEAWDAAARAVGEGQGKSLVQVLQITNPIGAQHQAALKACE